MTLVDDTIEELRLKDKNFKELYDIILSTPIGKGALYALIEIMFAAPTGVYAVLLKEKKLLYLHYLMFTAICMQKLDKAIIGMSLTDNTYLPGKELHYSHDEPLSEFKFKGINFIFDYKDMNDFVVLKVDTFGIEDFILNNLEDDWLDWPVLISVLGPGRSYNLGPHKLKEFNRNFVARLITE